MILDACHTARSRRRMNPPAIVYLRSIGIPQKPYSIGIPQNSISLYLVLIGKPLRFPFCLTKFWLRKRRSSACAAKSIREEYRLLICCLSRDGTQGGSEELTIVPCYADCSSLIARDTQSGEREGIFSLPAIG